MVAHERLTEPRVTTSELLAKPKSFSNLPAFSDLYGSYFDNLSINEEKTFMQYFTSEIEWITETHQLLYK